MRGRKNIPHALKGSENTPLKNLLSDRFFEKQNLKWAAGDPF